MVSIPARVVMGRAEKAPFLHVKPLERMPALLYTETYSPHYTYTL